MKDAQGVKGEDDDACAMKTQRAHTLRASVSCDSETAFICSSASAAEVKGLKAVSLTILPNLAMSLHTG